MKYYLLIITAVTLNVTILNAQKKDIKAIHKVFDAYKTATLNNQGADAVNLVDSLTLAYYEELSMKIKYADSAAVEALSFQDRLTLLMIRGRATREEIRKFDGRSLFIYAIDKGMTGKNSIINNTIGDVKVNGNYARAEFITKGVKTSMHYPFYREHKKWKINFTELFPIFAVTLKRMVDETEMSEQEMIKQLLEMSLNRSISPALWQPVLQK
ncbi:MAG: hypothetical protein ACT6QS_08660 [Flavobacteriales bacterium]